MVRGRFSLFPLFPLPRIQSANQKSITNNNRPLSTQFEFWGETQEWKEAESASFAPRPLAICQVIDYWLLIGLESEWKEAESASHQNYWLLIREITASLHSAFCQNGLSWLIALNDYWLLI